MTVCVLDAGPLIHLDELGALPLLGEMGMIFCPEEVLGEAERHRSGVGSRLEFVHVVAAPGPRPAGLKSIEGLHAGELAALAWAEKFGAEMFLSDDTAARRAAKEMGLEICGTVGVILHAVRGAKISAPDARELLGRIPTHSTLHLKRTLLASAISSLG